MGTKDWVEAKDFEWRVSLQKVSLIAELEIDDKEVERAEKVLGLLLETNPASRIAQTYPAFLAVTLATAGMRSWEEGTFYQKVADNLLTKKSAVESAAREFPSCLARFNLPGFRHAGGMTWVTPILLHGAIPLDHLDELLELLTRRRRQDPSLTGDSFVEWVRLSPAQVATEPKALTRFLEHGGDFASDFVGRVLDFIDGRDVVLPRRVIERLREVISDAPANRYARETTREDRPSIVRTHQGTLALRLPSVRPVDGRTVRWRVTSGDRLYEYVTEVPWGSTRGLSAGLLVDVDNPVRSIHVERETGSTDVAFVRKEDPLLVFDADGDLVTPTQVIPRGPVVLIWPDPEGSSIRPVDEAGTMIDGTEEYAPYGWEKWNALRADVSGAKYLRFGNGPRRIVAGADRPRIVAPDPVRNVMTLDDRDVLSALPEVQLPFDTDPGMWRILLTDTEGAVLESLQPSTHRVKLLVDRIGSASGNMILEVRGPLGRGTRRAFSVVEGLDVSFSPEFRALHADGGLVPAIVTVRSAERACQTVELGREQASTVVEFENLAVSVEPPHISFRAASPSGETPWVTAPVTVAAREIKDSTFTIAGWNLARRPQLVLTAGEFSQFVPAAEFRGGGATFRLAAFSHAIDKAGAGSLFLDVEPPVKVVNVRPSMLASNVVRAGNRLLVEPAVSVPLELAVYRAWAPWIAPQVLPVVDDQVVIPDALREAGTLRVEVRELDEWGVDPVGPLPPAGRKDVFDVEGDWNADVDQPETRALVRVLSDRAPVFDDPITDMTAARIFELLKHTADGQLSVPRRRHLVKLLSLRPDAAMQAVLETRAEAADITWGIVESGLLWAPVANFSRELDIEALARRSALAAAVAAASRIRWGNRDVEALLAQMAGNGIVTLAEGEDDDFRAGRFEDWYLTKPALVEYAYGLLNPVPTLPVDADTRIAASFEMWRGRTRLAEATKYAMSTIRVVRQVLVAEGMQQLWTMIQARLSQDGIVALPALSIALGIAARMAAHGFATAQNLVANDRYVYPQLARRAPRLVEIDAIRADAAVRSLLS